MTPDGIKKQVDLQETARRWRTPDCGGGSSLNGSGTKRNPLLAQQASLWATPTSHERTHAPRAVDHGEQLANQAATWITPTAHDGRRPSLDEHSKMGANLSRQVHETATAGASGSSGAVLNPYFVEALMGLPPSWTVPTGFDVSGTPSSPRKPKRRSRCSRSES